MGALRVAMVIVDVQYGRIRGFLLLLLKRVDISLRVQDYLPGFQVVLQRMAEDHNPRIQEQWSKVQLCVFLLRTLFPRSS